MKLSSTHSLVILLSTLTTVFSPASAKSNGLLKPATAGTLSAFIQAINRTTGEVTFNGGDSRGATMPGLTFTWKWGDGTSNNGFFPQTKVYADVSKNYLAKVIANYPDGQKDSVSILVEFVVPIISTVAGPNNVGDNGAASLATLNDPEAVATDASGAIYVAEGAANRIRKISSTGVITTIAGTGVAGFSGDGGPATTAKINNPSGIVVDGSGNIYFSDWYNNRIRKIGTNGIISTVAGTGAYGFSGDGGQATAAVLNGAYGIGIDGSDNIYIADWNNHRIRKVATTGIITTIAGTGTAGFSGDNGLATAAQLNSPTGVAVDASGNIYIGDYGNWRIRKIAANGTISTIAGTGVQGTSGDGGNATSAQLSFFAGPTVDASGNVFIADFANSRVRKISTTGTITRFAGLASGAGFSGDGGAATAAALLNPLGLAVSTSGNVIIADRYNQRIRQVNTSGVISTTAGPNNSGFGGDGDFATFARLNSPSDVKSDGNGNFYLTELSIGRVRKVDATGIITTVAGSSGAGFAGDNGPATSARLRIPFGVLPDGAGNLYIADTYNNRIRKVDASGVITTIAGTGTGGFAGDNGAATAAQLKLPYNIALDKAGNLYIADSDNNRIRKVSANGTITTVAGTGSAGFGGDGGTATAAQINYPTGIAFDAFDNLYIADNRNQRIRRVTAAGVISTIAGTGTVGYSGTNGPATSANLSYPFGIAVSPNSTVFFCDNGNTRVRKIATNGIITDVAGTSTRGFSGDGGLATQAQLDNPYGLSLDGYGNLLIADGANARIRRVACVDPPVVSITTNSLTVCAGDVVSLTTTVANNLNGVTYVWSGNAIPTGVNTASVSASSGTNTYSVVVTTPTGCATSASITLQAVSLASVKSGYWSDPSVWSCGRTPTVSDLVTVSTGHSLTLTTNGAAKSLILNGNLTNGIGGKLFLSDTNQVKIFDNVQVADAAIASTIVSLSNASITFSANPTINAYKIGDILVGGISDQAPYGFLRKVVSIQNNGSQIIFQTVNAGLDEVFQKGKVQFNLSGADISETENTGLRQAAPIGTSGEAKLAFNLNYNRKGALIDFDNNPQTTNDQIQYLLKLNNNLLPVLDWDFSRKYAKGQLSVNGDYSLDITLPPITASTTLQTTVKRWCNTMTRIIPVVVGPAIVLLPVILTTVTKINLGGEFSISAKQNTYKLSGKPQVILGAEYNDGNWKDLGSFGITDFKLSPLTLLPEYGQFNFKPFVTLPSMEVYVYDATAVNQCISVVQSEPKPDFVFASTVAANLAARLYPGDSLVMCASANVTLSADIKPTIFGIKLPQYKKSVSFDLKKEQCIGQVSSLTLTPVVTAQQVVTKSETEAEVQALIENYKVGKVISYGICYSSTTINPTVNDTKREINVEGEITDSKSFTLSATLLDPLTRYFVRAFARTATGVFYSDLLSFKTTGNVVVKTIQVSNIASTSAQVQASINNYKNGNITSYGICYSTTAIQPTVANTKVDFTVEANPPDSKTFTASLSGLAANTTHYARAYAITSAGTVYGEVLSFITSSTIVCSINSGSGNIWTNDNQKLSGGNAPFVEIGETHSEYSFGRSCVGPAGSIYYWDFGDGSPILQESNNGSSAKHIFRSEGTFNVNLKIVNNGTLIANVTRTATIKPARFWMSMKFNGTNYISSDVDGARATRSSYASAYYYASSGSLTLDYIFYWLNPNLFQVGSYSYASIKDSMRFDFTPLDNSSQFGPESGTITITRNDGVILEGTFSFRTKEYNRVTPRYIDVTEGTFRIPIFQ